MSARKKLPDRFLQCFLAARWPNNDGHNFQYTAFNYSQCYSNKHCKGRKMRRCFTAWLAAILSATKYYINTLAIRRMFSAWGIQNLIICSHSSTAGKLKGERWTDTSRPHRGNVKCKGRIEDTESLWPILGHSKDAHSLLPSGNILDKWRTHAVYCLWEIYCTHGGRKHKGHLEDTKSKWPNSNTGDTQRTYMVYCLREIDCLLTGRKNFYKGNFVFKQINIPRIHSLRSGYRELSTITVELQCVIRRIPQWANAHVRSI